MPCPDPAEHLASSPGAPPPGISPVAPPLPCWVSHCHRAAVPGLSLLGPLPSAGLHGSQSLASLTNSQGGCPALSGLMTSPAMWPRAGRLCLAVPAVPAVPLGYQPLLAKKPLKQKDPVAPQLCCSCWDPGAQRLSALSWSLGNNA